jgi:hypothetical protein
MPKGNPIGGCPGGPTEAPIPPPPPRGCPHEGAPAIEVVRAVVEVGKVTLVLMLLFACIAAAAIAAIPAAKK